MTDATDPKSAGLRELDGSPQVAALSGVDDGTTAVTAGDAVEIPLARPLPGQTVALAIEDGQRYLIDFDPRGIVPDLQGDDFVLLSEADDGRLVFLDLVPLVESGAEILLRIGDVVITGSFMIEFARAAGDEPREIIEAAEEAEALREGRGEAREFGTGELINLLDPQGDLPLRPLQLAQVSPGEGGSDVLGGDDLGVVVVGFGPSSDPDVDDPITIKFTGREDTPSDVAILAETPTPGAIVVRVVLDLGVQLEPLDGGDPAFWRIDLAGLSAALDGLAPGEINRDGGVVQRWELDATRGLLTISLKEAGETTSSFDFTFALVPPRNSDGDIVGEASSTSMDPETRAEANDTRTLRFEVDAVVDGTETRLADQVIADDTFLVGTLNALATGLQLSLSPTDQASQEAVSDSFADPSERITSIQVTLSAGTLTFNDPAVPVAIEPADAGTSWLFDTSGLSLDQAQALVESFAVERPAMSFTDTIRVSIETTTADIPTDDETDPSNNVEVDRHEFAVTFTPPPVSTLSIDDPTVTEGNPSGPDATITFTVTLAGATPSGPVTVDYAVMAQSASEGDDYRGGDPFDELTGTLVFLASEISKTITLDVVDDLLPEATETLKITLSNPSGAQITKSEGIGTILDTDQTVSTLSIDDPTVTEGNPGGPDATITFTVTLAGATPSGPVTVDYAVMAQSASEGDDYRGGAPFDELNGRLVFQAGEDSKTITLDVVDDLLPEATETLKVTLSSPSGAVIIKSEGTGTILDTDPPPPTPFLSINDPTVTEGNPGGPDATITFVVTLMGAPPSGSVTVDYTVMAQTASEGSDYRGGDPFDELTGTLVFQAGEDSKTITLDVVDDLLPEATETLKVTLSNPSGAVIIKSEGTGTILDTDLPPPTVTVTHDESSGTQNTGIPDLPREDNDDDDTADPDVIALFDTVADKGVDEDAGGLPGFARSDGAVVTTAGPDSNLAVDGQDVTTVLSLRVTNTASGLTTTDGHDIVLTPEDGLIVGRAATGPDIGKAAFAIAIDQDGFVSLAQYLSLKHEVPGNLDETIAIARGAVEAVVTVTDGGEDQRTDSVDIGPQIRFEDDGPTAADDMAMVTEPPVEVVDLTVILDVSSSMSGDKIVLSKELLKDLVQRLGAADQAVSLMIIPFDETSPPDDAPGGESSFSLSIGAFTLGGPGEDDLASANDYIDSIGTGRGTDYNAAFDQAKRSIAVQAGTAERVIFLSDGMPSRGEDPDFERWQAFLADPAGDRSAPPIETFAVAVGLDPDDPANADAILTLSGLDSPDKDRITFATLGEPRDGVLDDLLDGLPPPPIGVTVTGNILANDSFGADGASPGMEIARIVSDDFTFDHDSGTVTATAPVGPIGLGTAVASFEDGVLTIDTELGRLELRLLAGATSDPADAVGFFTYTADSPVQHGASDSVIDRFTYTIVDGDGDSATADLAIQIVDGVPTAQPNGVDVNEAPGIINLTFVVDYSSSMQALADPGDPQGPSRLEVEQAAIRNLLDLYAQAGSQVNVLLVIFDEAATLWNGAVVADGMSGWIVDDIAAAKAAVDAIPTTGFGTNYTDALEETIARFETGLPGADRSVLYFTSDGKPTRGGDPDHTIPDTTIDAWESFLIEHDMAALTVGIGSTLGRDDPDLEDVAFPNDDPGNPVTVEKPSDLQDALFDLDPGITLVSGNVLLDPSAGGMVDDFGADGAGAPRIVSITVDQSIGLVRYSFDGAVITNDRGLAAVPGSELEVTTGLGGKLTFDFDNGTFHYLAVSVMQDATDVFEYSIVDSDGDRDSALLTVSIKDQAPPRALAETVLAGDPTEVIPDAWLTANDGDPNGGALSGQWVAGATGGSLPSGSAGGGSLELLASSALDEIIIDGPADGLATIIGLRSADNVVELGEVLSGFDPMTDDTGDVVDLSVASDRTSIDPQGSSAGAAFMAIVEVAGDGVSMDDGLSVVVDAAGTLVQADAS